MDERAVSFISCEVSEALPLEDQSADGGEAVGFAVVAARGEVEVVPGDAAGGFEGIAEVVGEVGGLGEEGGDVGGIVGEVC